MRFLYKKKRCVLQNKKQEEANAQYQQPQQQTYQQPQQESQVVQPTQAGFELAKTKFMVWRKC